MSVLRDPATYGIPNSELTNCPRTAAVLGELAGQWQQNDGDPSTSRTRDRVITESDHRHGEYEQGTNRRDRKSSSTAGRRATLPEELVEQHATRRVRTRGRCMAGLCRSEARQITKGPLRATEAWTDGRHAMDDKYLELDVDHHQRNDGRRRTGTNGTWDMLARTMLR